jgi:hypothetical protein
MFSPQMNQKRLIFAFKKKGSIIKHITRKGGLASEQKAPRVAMSRDMRQKEKVAKIWL